ncbi:ROK family protein [Candidatus Woesearchaeota archaeon]|nr:MAG: ROK family protein [Candidatus Woesearchaeota archaeon]
MVKYALAVDIGATNVRVALGDEKGNIIVKIKEKTKENKLVKQILKLVELVCESREVEVAGIGSLGPLDFVNKKIVRSPNLNIKNISLAKLKNLAKDVYLLNDATAAVVGEKYYGAGVNAKNIVYVTISSGIGAGVVVDGNLLWGKSGNAAELGHMYVGSEYGLKCTCGYKNHWQAYASGIAHTDFYKQFQKSKGVKKPLKLSSKEIFKLARQGDKMALKFVDELGKINARAVSNITVAYDPEIITLGGSVAQNENKLILNPIKKYVEQYLKLPKIMLSPLGNDAVLIGALAAAWNKVGAKL